MNCNQWTRKLCKYILPDAVGDVNIGQKQIYAKIRFEKFLITATVDGNKVLHDREKGHGG